MKQTLIVFSLLACVFFIGCGKPTALQPMDDVINHAGTIMQIDSLFFGIVDDAEWGERFAPSNLPESFKIDGLRVIFSGRRGMIPPNVRLWGTPLELTSIQINTK